MSPALLAKIEDGIDRSGWPSRQVLRRPMVTLDHRFDELQLVLHRLQELLRHFTAPGDRCR